MADELNFKIPLNDGVKEDKGNTSLIDKTQPQEQPKSSGFFGCFSIDFYRPYFNVTTDDVKERLIVAVDPRRNDFFEVIGGRSDFYGPFWIYTTLVFVLVAAGNMHAYVLALMNDWDFTSRFDFVPVAVSTFYGYGFFVPVIFTGLLKCLGSKDIKFSDTICIYGYSLAILIPVFILAIIPSSLFVLIMLVVALGSSTWFLLQNYNEELKKYTGNSRYLLLGFLGLAQIALLITFKWKIFDAVYESYDIYMKAKNTAPVN